MEVLYGSPFGSEFPADGNVQDELSQRSQIPIKEELQATCTNLLTNEQLALAYIVIFSGLELAFWTGEFPQVIRSTSFLKQILLVTS